ncbi:MAG: hypothetical protein JW782_06805 [Candidatus Saganbacteria bacterium]|nr:hypothetical protein [Candidatus Saganbacteria bacterium]
MDQATYITEDQQRVLWYVKLRWGALLLITTVCLYLKFVGRFRFPLLPCLIVTAAASLYNLIYPFLTRRFPGFSENRTLSDIRTIADLIVITLLIHFTGGIESPFIMLYLLELVALSMFRFTWSAYYLAALATTFYLSACFLEAYFILPHYRLSHISGTLFVSPNYILAIGFALFICCILLIYMTSFLSERFAERQHKIEELSNAKLDFMNQVMHETKSPLTSIIGYTDILLRGNFGELNKEQLPPMGVIQRQSQRILDMVNNLLDIARLESGKTKLETKNLSLSELIGHAIEEMTPQLSSKKLELIQELASDLPLLKLDETKVLEVLINLISNAVKFSNPQGKIFISTQKTGSEVQVAVRDEGLGIEAEDLPNIFEKFHRASKEAAQVRGTGLGLALSKSIVEAHGGRMWAVSSGRNKGAVFYFTLPLSPSA